MDKEKIVPPTLETERLILRRYRLTDAEQIAEHLNEKDVAYNTLRIPHPYSVKDAESFIQGLQDTDEVVFALVNKENEQVIGSVGLMLNPEHDHAAIGYWLGKPFWGRGLVTEAARKLLDFGFRDLSLNCISGEAYGRNRASSRVMEKLGMKHEGTLRQRYKKWGEYVDCDAYSILRSEYIDMQESR